MFYWTSTKNVIEIIKIYRLLKTVIKLGWVLINYFLSLYVFEVKYTVLIFVVQGIELYIFKPDKMADFLDSEAEESEVTLQNSKLLAISK